MGQRIGDCPSDKSTRVVRTSYRSPEQSETDEIHARLTPPRDSLLQRAQKVEQVLLLMLAHRIEERDHLVGF